MQQIIIGFNIPDASMVKQVLLDNKITILDEHLVKNGFILCESDLDITLIQSLKGVTTAFINGRVEVPTTQHDLK